MAENIGSTEYEELNIKSKYGEIEELEDEVEKRFKNFKNFDTVPHPPQDHHYLNSLEWGRSTLLYGVHTAEAWKNIRSREWENLKTASFPKTMFIRVYESRCDLMRVAIIGPDNTPYRHGLFFFDVLFPENYPAQPPELFYHSHGIDVNPKLNHKTGKVSLNLVSNAGCQWFGYYKEEKWDPEESNILQVLKSIRDSILSGTNKDVFMQTCETMLYTMNQPPYGFEDFVAGFFRHQAHSILMNFRGCAENNTNNNNATMKNMFFKLYDAFEQNGTYCKHHLIGSLKKGGERERESEETDNKRKNTILTGLCKNPFFLGFLFIFLV